VRAVEAAVAGEAPDDEPDVRAISREMKERWGPVLDRLGSV